MPEFFIIAPWPVSNWVPPEAERTQKRKQNGKKRAEGEGEEEKEEEGEEEGEGRGKKARKARPNQRGRMEAGDGHDVCKWIGMEVVARLLLVVGVSLVLRNSAAKMKVWS